ncbi:MAG: hypothetical protein AABP62_06380 [Planctomycetota bacterium]
MVFRIAASRLEVWQWKTRCGSAGSKKEQENGGQENGNGHASFFPIFLSTIFLLKSSDDYSLMTLDGEELQQDTDS